MIFIITNKDDVTTDIIVNRLNKTESNYFRFNTEELGNSIEITMDYYNSIFELYDKNIKKSILMNDIKSIYFRRPKLPDLEKLNLSYEEMDFITSEYSCVLEGMYKILRKKYWLNSVFSIREAENKLFQLIKAKEIDFLIPKGLITNQTERAKTFLYLNNNNVIIKAIDVGFIKGIKEDQIIFTSKLKNGQINNIERVVSAPTYFQENILKKSDIRATVVGNKVFAAEILSQEFDETKTDWRKNENIDIEHRRIKLPKNLEEKCIKLTKEFGLRFGAIDLILDKNGDFYFLEINPNGQWGWIEMRLEYDISGSIIELLRSQGEGEQNEDIRN